MADKPKKTQLSVSLDEATAAELRQKADERQVHPTFLVERALKMYLPTLKPIEDFA